MNTKMRKLKREFFALLSRRAIVVSVVCATTILCIAAAISSVNTYIFYDGESVSVLNSSVKTCAEAVKEADLVIGENDYIEMPDAPSEGVARIYIHRQKAVNLNYGGEKNVLYAESEKTLSELLEKNKIDVSDTDITSIPLSSPITDGMSVDITKVSYSTEEKTESIPFSTVKRPSANMNAGTTKVVQKGVYGSKKLIYSVETTNGAVTGRSLVNETVVTNPVNQIVEYGTKKADASGVVTTSAGTALKYKKAIKMTATAYTTERSSKKTTATGKVARVGLVAVDPKVIPLGSKLYIVSSDGKSWSYGTAVAADTGVRGNKIDLFYNTYRECINFGRRSAMVYVLE